MTDKSPSPELVKAYQLIKQGERQQAGELLKGYLKTHPDDADAWWLMAHAVTKPENVQRSLERLLKIDPTHEKARKKLAKLVDEAKPPAQRPPVQKPPVVAPLPTPPQPKTPSVPEQADTFEAYLSQNEAPDPFAASPAIDPFAYVPDSDDAVETATEETAKDGLGLYNPFAASSRFDPSAGVSLRNEAHTAQVAGTGDQPEWGPGLAFVQEGDSSGEAARFDYSKVGLDLDGETRAKQPSYEALIGWGLAAVAVVVLIGLVAYFVLNRGDDVPDMVTLDGRTFTVEYPQGWDMQCGYERSGYQVCGIANHKFYNPLAAYLGQNVDIGQMVSDAFSMMFSGGDNLPDHAVAIVIMDVPESSPSYDNGSWAKTRYEWSQSEWSFAEYDDVFYDSQTEPPRQVAGRDAYYYEFKASSSIGGRDVAYDVYIPHDGIMLWMTVSISGPKRGKDYDAMIQAMIDSIQIKPVSEWSG